MKNYITYGILALTLALLVFTLVDFSPVNAVQVNEKSTNEFETISSGTTGMGDVSIALTPRIENDRLIVELAANTHSVNLGQFNLAELVVLEYEGKEIKPVSVPSLGGHHSNGELVFDAAPEKFTIKIKGIPKIEERIFEWR